MLDMNNINLDHLKLRIKIKIIIIILIIIIKINYIMLIVLVVNRINLCLVWVFIVKLKINKNKNKIILLKEYNFYNQLIKDIIVWLNKLFKCKEIIQRKIINFNVVLKEINILHKMSFYRRKDFKQLFLIYLNKILLRLILINH